MESRLLLKEKRKRIRHPERPKPTSQGCVCDFKIISFIIIGGLTLVYCIVELGAAVYLRSLTLLSDGFHNLSDVISLYIAFWAAQAAKRETTDSMSYGWVRSEILGGLTNGCFLLSLSLYVVLEAIPRFIDPPELDAGWPFIAVAGGGLAVNTIGTLAFAATGISHGHSHSHGGGHGHSHGHGASEHDEKKSKKHRGHSHSHGEHDEREWDEMSALLPSEETKAHQHDHHGHSHGGHEHKSRGGFRIKLDLNMWGVFIHYLGDMVSSAVVLATGILLHFVDGTWTLYIDPAASLLIVGLILWTTVPLVRECSMILLQSTPPSIPLQGIKEEIYGIQGVESVHDLHIWQLSEGKMVASVHVSFEEGMAFNPCLQAVKEIFHSHGIHSMTIQPEFVPKNYPAQEFCEENCVQDCEEDWCCKKTAERVIRESGFDPRQARQVKSVHHEKESGSNGQLLLDPSVSMNHHDADMHHHHDDGDDEDEDGHSHGHSHGHGHSHSHGHAHSHGHGHDHDDSHDEAEDISGKL